MNFSLKPREEGRGSLARHVILSTPEQATWAHIKNIYKCLTSPTLPLIIMHLSTTPTVDHCTMPKHPSMCPQLLPSIQEAF